LKYRVVPLGVTLQPPELAILPEEPPIFKLAAVPVAFVATKADGVPKFGVDNVGLLAKTTAPEPVEVVPPVPPFAIFNVPATVIEPDVEVEGVKPVVPNEIAVTATPDKVVHCGAVPLEVRI
jgi:hypothetical protein